MSNDHIHKALAEQREAEVRRAVRPPGRRTSWFDVAPVLGLAAGLAGVLAVADPSL